MFISHLNPVFFRWGKIEIRYYGLIWAFSFLLALKIISSLVKRKKIEIKKDELFNLCFYVLLGGIIGARLFYILIYNLRFYLIHPYEMLALWHGGLSIHGGLVGGTLAGLLYCLRHKINFFLFADLFVIPLSLCLCLGRIGNFINGELYGRLTSVPWAVKFPGVEGFRHPAQLYASLKNLIIFLFLLRLEKKGQKEGFLFFSFLFLYSLFRFLVEFFRAPDPQLGFLWGGLTMGQILSLPFFLIGAGGMLWVYKKA
ncbi:MAG: prolipoprotein diacylglyceryl transferase [Candidatus Omnitrophota bacterium]|nr:MAG: prolipoprotein diacylglyceryl transferase [Candidatus Omnitrophota bacterium]